MIQSRALGVTLLALSGCLVTASAQVSLASAVDMALRNSPRVKMAETDVTRARAGVAQAKDVYIPNLVGATTGLGYAYGFPLSPPTVFTFSSGSLVFSYSQRDYIRAASDGLTASTLALRDIRQAVAEDTVNTYLDLSRLQAQHAALKQEADSASRLETIVKERLDSGLDSRMEYTRARRTGVQIRLQLLQMEDDLASSQDHLSRLLGVPGQPIQVLPDSVPAIAVDAGDADKPISAPDTPGVKASFVSAHQKLEQAFGDSRYLWRPQVTFGAEYSREAFYNNGYLAYYPYVTGANPVTGLGAGSLPVDSVGFALNVSIPIWDKSRRDRAKETMAEALHSFHDADNIRDQELEGRLRLQHSTRELAARAELASLDRDIAQEQLENILTQLQSPPSGPSPALTPKEEQNARIQERQRYIEMIDAQFKLRQAEVNLLRQTGKLEDWLRSSDHLSISPVPVKP